MDQILLEMNIVVDVESPKRDIENRSREKSGEEGGKVARDVLGVIDAVDGRLRLLLLNANDAVGVSLDVILHDALLVRHVNAAALLHAEEARQDRVVGADERANGSAHAIDEKLQRL